MATRIDEDRSPESVTVVRGDTAMLVCTVINIGDKSVGFFYFTSGPVPVVLRVLPLKEGRVLDSQ